MDTHGQGNEEAVAEDKRAWALIKNPMARTKKVHLQMDECAFVPEL